MVSLTGIIRQMHNTRAAHGTITLTVVTTTTRTTVVEVESTSFSREQTRRAANDAPDGYRLTALPSQFSPSTHVDSSIPSLGTATIAQQPATTPTHHTTRPAVTRHDNREKRGTKIIAALGLFSIHRRLQSIPFDSINSILIRAYESFHFNSTPFFPFLFVFILC